MTVGEGCSYYCSLFTFAKDLYNYSDRDVRKVCGTDVVLYLTLLKYSAYLFGTSKFAHSLVMIVNLVVMLPMYMTADENNNYTILQRLTVLTNLENYYLMWIVFFFTIVYSMFGHILLHLLEEKRRQQSMIQSSNEESLNEVHLANHSVLVRGINPDMGPEHVETILLKILEQEYPNRFADCHALGRF